MNSNRRSERGQVLVLIVAGMIALIAVTALAVDGGNVYSDRRHAQNAADTAAMAAGLSWIHSNDIAGITPPNMPAWPAAEAAGLNRAQANGYDSSSGSSVVVRLCSDPAATCIVPPPEPYTDNNHNGQYDYGEPFTDANGNGVYDSNQAFDFIEVIITSHVNT